ncbi:hypothetical protein L7F22_037627 [Adiantum nelumboides]|nr:hypothetical protein [Adiantum nelumboides]
MASQIPCISCGGTNELFMSPCHHLIICVSCSKRIIESATPCPNCGVVVTRIIREFDIKAWPTTKPCFVGRFLQGMPSFRKKKDSDPQWTMQRVGAQGQQVTKALWEKYERKSWLLKDDQGKQSLHGSLVGGQQASYYLLVVHGKDILVKPAEPSPFSPESNASGTRYTFRKVTEYKQFTLEEAEERMKKRRKTADDYQRWLMKTANIGAAGFCEVEKSSGGGGGRGGFKRRADDVYDYDNSSFSDEGEDDAEEEENIKARLGINKKAGVEDGGKPARRDDRKLDDEEPERGGDGWEHEQIFTDDDEAAGHDTEESEDNPPEVPCSPEIKQTAAEARPGVPPGHKAKTNPQSTGTVTEEDIKAVLRQGPISSKDLVKEFSKRLVSSEDRAAFNALVKKISRIFTTDAGKFIMLRAEK